MKKRIFIIILAAVVVFCSVFTFIAHGKYEKIFTPEKWDSNIWKREKMIDNLTEQYDLYQMSYYDVIDLLGTNGLAESRTNENSCLTYYIGKGIIDPMLFTISFNEKGIVEKYSVAYG